MSTRPSLALWAGLRRTRTVVQLSRGRSRRQICVRVTIGGWAQGAPAATCAKKRTRSPSGRASILKKGLALHDFPPLKESCLIWWMTVRQGWRPPAGTSCGQSPAILKEKRYHTSSSNFTSSPAPVARSDRTWISARSLGPILRLFDRSFVDRTRKDASDPTIFDENHRVVLLPAVPAKEGRVQPSI